MKLEEITWVQAGKYFKEHDSVIIPVGSTECHGKHMPLGTDFLIPNKILERIDQKSDVLIAPTIPYGACDSLSDYPGTINIGDDVLYQLLDRVMGELYKHGARRLLVLNGHGGNIKTIERLGYKYEKMGAYVVMLNWWLMAWELNPAWKGGHGGAEETAGIMAVNKDLIDYDFIDEPLVYKDIAKDFETTGFRTVKHNGVTVEIIRKTPNVTDNGWIGPDHPSKATEAWGKEMVETTADYIVQFAEDFKQVALPKEQ